MQAAEDAGRTPLLAKPDQKQGGQMKVSNKCLKWRRVTKYGLVAKPSDLQNAMKTFARHVDGGLQG